MKYFLRETLRVWPFYLAMFVFFSLVCYLADAIPSLAKALMAGIISSFLVPFALIFLRGVNYPFVGGFYDRIPEYDGKRLYEVLFPNLKGKAANLATRFTSLAILIGTAVIVCKLFEFAALS